MRLKQILEGIRMGHSDLMQKTDKDYTVGFEFEVATYISEDENPSYDNLIRDREFHEKWFNETQLESTIDRIRDEHIEPVYGRPDSEEIIEFVIKDRKRKYNESMRKEINDFLDFIEKDLNILKDINILYKLMKYYYIILASHEEKHIMIRVDDDYVKRITRSNHEKFNGQESVFKNMNKAFIKTIRSAINIDISEIDDTIDIEDYAYDENYQVQFIPYLQSLTDIIKVFDSHQIQDEEVTIDYDEYVQEYVEENSISPVKYVVNELDSIMSRPVIESEESDYEMWTVGTDGTAGVDVEFRSPVLRIQEAEKALKDSLDLISNDSLIETNTNCGLHINIGTWNRNEINDVDWLKFYVISGQSRALKEFGRSNNYFAVDQLPGIIRSLETNKLNDYIDNIPSLNELAISLSEKYSAINLSKLPTHGYIELRSLGGNYEDKYEWIQQYIRMMTRILDIASDYSAYRQTYLKKLMTIMSSSGKNQTQKRELSLGKIIGIHFDLDNHTSNTSFYGDNYAIISYLPDVIEDSNNIGTVSYIKNNYNLSMRRELISAINANIHHTHEMRKLVDAITTKYGSNPEIMFLRDILRSVNIPENNS